MKNFGDFFYQPITIINPFEAYDPPEKVNQVLASFYPEGNSLVEGAPNMVVCHVRNEHGNGLDLSGRLVDSGGEKILDFRPGPLGIGRFEFTPGQGQKYQMILEDGAGAFHFFKLPGPIKAANVSIAKKGTQFEVEIKCSPSLRGGEGVLELKGRQNTLAVKKVNFGSKYVFNKSDFPSGTLLAVLKNREGEVLSQRPFHLPGKGPLLSSKGQRAVYARRQKVSLDYNIGFNAKLSISVRKKNLPISLERTGIAPFIEVMSNLKSRDIYRKGWPLNGPAMFYDDLLIISAFKKDFQFHEEVPVKLLPEYRHDLIEGYLLDQDDLPVPDKFMCLSLPGKNFQVAMGKTDRSGRFLIPVVAPAQNRLGYLKVLEEVPNTYNLNFSPEFREHYPLFRHQPVVLDSQSVATIVQKSIHTQIENAYFDLRSRSGEMQVKPFFTHLDYDRKFFLDDYTRFPSMREVFHEYIPLVNVSKNENDFTLSYRILDLPQQFLKRDLLILLDGVPISRRQALMLDPYKIESINLANNRHYLGPYVADGIISLHTYEGDLHGTELVETTFKYNYAGLQTKNTYHFPDYAFSAKTKLPDKREQLYWAPEVNVVKGETLKLEFFTSDVPGNYEIEVEGISDRGLPVSMRGNFRVQ